MQWIDPYERTGHMGCAFTLDIDYGSPRSSQDVLSLGQVWEVGKDLRLKCEDGYMASETIGPHDKIRLSKRFVRFQRPGSIGDVRNETVASEATS